LQRKCLLLTQSGHRSFGWTTVQLEIAFPVLEIVSLIRTPVPTGRRS
jgi:hypothetical protein